MIDFLQLQNKKITSITDCDNNLFIVADGVEYCLEPSLVENIKYLVIVNRLLTRTRDNIVKYVNYYTHDTILNFELNFNHTTMSIIIQCDTQPKNYNIKLIKTGNVSIIENRKLGPYDNEIRDNLINRFIVSELSKLNVLIGKSIDVESKGRQLLVTTDKNERFMITSTNGNHGYNNFNDVKISYGGPILSIDKCIRTDKVSLSLIMKDQIVPILIPYKRINSFKINIEEGYNLI